MSDKIYLPKGTKCNANSDKPRWSCTYTHPITGALFYDSGSGRNGAEKKLMLTLKSHNVITSKKFEKQCVCDCHDCPCPCHE